jgi:hypothetical protein
MFGTPSDTLLLSLNDFETEIFESQGKKENHQLSIIELSDRHPNAKQTFNDFRDLSWQIIKARNEEKFVDFIPALENYQNATLLSPLHQFYNLRNINDNKEYVKEICQGDLLKMRNLNR